MSSFMFFSFDQTMAWDGYSFYSNSTALKIQLLDPSFFVGSVPTTAKNTYSDISQMSAYLLSGTDKSLTNVATSAAADSSSIILISDDYNLYPSSVTTQGAVVYDANNFLICVIDFGSTQNTVSGTFNIPLSKGIIRIR